MSLRSLHAVWLCLALGCGAPQTTNEPTTAKEKQLREAKAKGEVDPREKRWGGWRYQGDREDCFFVVGRKCFKTEKTACDAAKCQTPKKCSSDGGGPATLTCK